ncbi:cation diffusion facilitator family transporter [Candidatus Nitrotoga sp. M5]|uniref:cation diffusion facilitator family transporter n=1 Tax=Candidatus Nitrotoga sp. M5 TaxID=2890409 RepID=UPI001EF339E3|nr:cation diffusion facilitator family transporter [Candidatus Nitrotoga sp. M5]
MSHSHNHQHNVKNYNRAFAIGVFLNVVYVLIEAGYGFAINSLALIADAGHNLSDVASLLLAWGASILSQKAATEKHTYGYRKATVLASLFSGILLLVVTGGIAWEAINRIFEPRPIEGMTIIVVAGIGVVINTLTALLFLKDKDHDLNIRGAFLHMAADAGISLAVVLAGILILYGEWLWADPVISLFIAVIILFATWGLLRESINYSLDAVPQHIDKKGIIKYLTSFTHVNAIHDLHIWPLSTTEVALTVHLIVDVNHIDNNFLSNVQHHLHDSFQIEHSTIQVETSEDNNYCMLQGGSKPKLANE